MAIAFVMTTRGRTTGLQAAQEAAALCDVRAGKITRLAFFPTWEEAVGT